MEHLPVKRLLLVLLSLYISVANAQTFTEVSQPAGIDHVVYSPAQLGGGAAFFDYNNDGWLDLYITGGLNRDKLYHNNGDGTFTERGIAAGLYGDGAFFTMGAVTGDIDNDGYRDILVTTWGNSVDWAEAVRNILYRNNGDETFTDIALTAGLTEASWSVSATMGDYNLDGYLDIYIGNYVDSNAFIRDSITNEIIGFAHIGYPNFLYVNNRNNTFTQIAPQLNMDDRGTTLANTFTDYDNDHDPDLYVVNDFGAWVLPNALFRNEYPVNSFTDVSTASGANAGIYGMGVAPGDYDEDGDLDYYLTNIGENVLYRNNGNGTFTDVADTAGVTNGYTDDTLFTTGWGTAFFDYDNNTWLDLFISNGRIATADIIATGEKDPNKLFRNNMDGTFSDVSALEGVRDTTKGRGFATGDYDNDGDLDMVVVCTHHFSPSTVRTLLYRNDQSNGNHWLKVKLQGTTNNRDAFGARVEAHTGGRKWIREIDGGSSHASQNSSIAHFGLGNYTMVDSLVVIWPGGNRTVLQNLQADNLISIVESGQTHIVQDVFTSICEGDSLNAGGAWQTITGIYFDTFALSGGIDSIVVTHLTVLPSKFTILDYVVCEDDSVLVNGVYFYGDTTLTETLVAANGCDSIITSQITMIPWTIAIADAFICEGDSIFAGGAWQTQSGSYYDTIPGNAICDHLIITAVQVIPVSERDTVDAFMCVGDSLFVGGAYQTVTGFYSDTFTVNFGCDSIVVTNLSIVSQHITTLSLALCSGDSIYAAGAFQTEAGTYYDTLISSGNCDSIVISNVSIDSVFLTEIDHSIIEGDSFFVGGAWQTEQGLYADTFAAVNGCDSVVLTELDVEVGIEGVSPNDFSLTVYPNPSNLNFTVAFSILKEQLVSLSLLDISGKEVLPVLNEAKSVGDHKLEILTNALAPGAYLLLFKTDDFSKQVKVILL